MAIAMGGASIALILLFTTLAVMMILRIGFGRLESLDGISRDGPKHGLPFPTVGSMLIERSSLDMVHLVVFTDHSLESFPPLIHAINRFHQDSELDITVLVHERAMPGVVERLVRGVPTRIVAEAMFIRLGIRVIPFGVLLDRRGVVIWTGVVSSEAQVRWILRRHQRAVEHGVRAA